MYIYRYYFFNVIRTFFSFLFEFIIAQKKKKKKTILKY